MGRRRKDKGPKYFLLALPDGKFYVSGPNVPNALWPKGGSTPLGVHNDTASIDRARRKAAMILHCDEDEIGGIY